MIEVIVHGAGLSGTLVARELIRQSRITSRATTAADDRDDQRVSDPAGQCAVFETPQEVRAAFYG